MLGRQVGVHHAFVRHDAVVAIRAAEVALVVFVPAAGRHGGVVKEGVGLGFCAEGRGEGLHELKAQGGFAVEDSGAGVRAGVDLVGLGAGEPRGEENLGAVQEDIQAEMVAVEGQAPGSLGGGAAEEDEVVGVFVHY